MRTLNHRISTSRRLAAALVLALAAGACGDDGGTAPETRSGLALSVTSALQQASSGRLHISGPQNLVRTLSPGASEEIDLPPGSYTVALEGLSGSTVVEYWERGATVSEGQQTQLTVNLVAFRGGSPPSAVGQAFSEAPFVVSWPAVSGAASYDLQASTSPTFASVSSELNVTQTSAEVSVTGTATVYFRVRARTRFNGVGDFGPVSSGTEVRLPVSSVDVTPQDEVLDVGQTRTYQAVPRGPQGQVLTGRSVTWSSTDPSVATVNSSSGLVTAVSGGTTTIVATSDGATGSATLTVREVPASVTIDPSAFALPLNGTRQLTATVRSGGGAALSGFNVIWSSDDTGVATVDGTGLVTGAGGGSTTIRATVEGFESASGSAAVAVDAGSPPQVTDYQVDFLPYVASCRDDDGDFRTIERVSYDDPDDDMDPAGPFEEPGGATPPQGIDTQFRAAGNTVWLEFNARKTWTPQGGASPSTGTLDADQATCFSGGDAELQYLDFRVRVQDANGNWSDWFETRRYLPEVVTLTPGPQIALDPGGGAQQFTAQVTDFSGAPVPADVVSWSSYVGPELASMSAGGRYTLNGTAQGLDFAVARAAYARRLTAVQIGFADQMWFSPGWSFPGVSTTISFRTRVYAGREYTFTTAPGDATSGNIDLYIRAGAQASTSLFDESSTGPGMAEQITYTAQSDGVVWVLVRVVTPPNTAGATFNIGGDNVPPRSRETLPAGAPASPGPPSTGLQDVGLGGPASSAAGVRTPAAPFTLRRPPGGS